MYIHDRTTRKEKVCVEAFFIIISTRHEVAVLRCAIAIDILTIYELFIRIIEGDLRDTEHEGMPLLSEALFPVYILSEGESIEAITPPVCLIPDSTFGIF